MKWYAHTSDTQEWQPLKEHLESVALLASDKAKKFNSEKFAYLIGLLHDVGKYTDVFQQRLLGSSQTLDHAIVGAKILEEYRASCKHFKVISTLLAYPIAGHHTGLPDCGAIANDSGTLAGRLTKQMPNYSAWKDEISFDNITNVGDLEKLAQSMPQLKIPHNKDLFAFSIAFWVRMLFSCLVDADFLDTEKFCDPDKFFHRKSSKLSYDSIDILDKYVKEKSEKCLDTAINKSRNKIFSLCKEKALEKQGIFSLTVPTGGGKTLSSMAFALEHAKQHKLDRVIYVIPYTSIIEQSAIIFREIFGDESILEHHCNYVSDDVPDSKSLSIKLATENWESEIVLTTAVQFFESLFSHKSSRCRKLHNIVKSVVIIDEAQMLPLHLLSPSILAMKELIANYDTTILLCTATQPALSTLYIPEADKYLLKYGFSKEEIQEVIPKDYLNELFDIFKRTKVEAKGTLTFEEIKSLLLEEEQCLCIVNTRAQAQKLFRFISESNDVFHLSTYMFPTHRKKVLDEIRERLKNKEKCIVISTSLIECGVDISFPHVLRAYGGLDSIAQAAGRCNREGELSCGMVTLFDFEAEVSSKDSSLQRRISVSKKMYEKYKDELFSPQAIQEYFYHLYSYEDMDNSKIVNEFKENKPPDFNFKTVSEEFCFINNNQVSIIVDPQVIEKENKSIELFQSKLESLRYCGMNRELRQYFQQFSVQVYEHEVKKLYENGMIYKENDFYISSIGYDQKIGLCSSDDYFISSESLMF